MSDVLEDIILKLEEEAISLPETKNRCTQHLIELGYLPLTKVNALSEKDIEDAKILFLEEALVSGFYALHTLESASSFSEYESIAAHLLDLATDIDEGFIFEKLPEPGALNLQSRILHYRLDIFGLWPHPVSKGYDIFNSKAALGIIGEFLDCDLVSAVNMMANMEKLTRRLLEIHPDEDFILTIKPKHQVERSLQRSLNKTQRFKRQLIDDFGERTEFFKYLNKEVLKENPNKVDFNFMNGELRNPFKQFVMRLIQVHQWQEGSYTGLLDSDIGEVTLRSILHSIDFFNASSSKNIREFRVLTHVINDYYLFNGLFFLQEYVVDNEDVDNPEQIILNDLLHNLQNAGDGELNAFELNMAVLKTEIALATEVQPKERHGLLQRVYFGFRRFLKKVVKISKKIFRWVVELAEKFRDILKKVFGQVFEDLYTGIKAFIDGMKFLLGRKATITSDEENMIASVIRLDGDCYNIISGGTATLLIEHHIKSIQYHVKSMHFALTVIGGVLRTFLNAIAVFSWPLLVFTIVKVVRNIKESYQKLNLVIN